MPRQDDSPLALLRQAAVKVRKQREAREREQLESSEQPFLPQSLDEAGALIPGAARGAASSMESAFGGLRNVAETAFPPGRRALNPLYVVPKMLEDAASKAVDYWGGKLPEGQGSFLTRQIPEAIGSSLPFLVSGGAPGAAAIGALQGADKQFDESEAKGIKGPQKWKAVLLGAGLGGVTESLGGVARAASRLARIDARSGGMLSRVFREAGEEGVQEALQSLGEGAIAEHIRDEDVAYFDKAFFESVKTGVAAGAFFGALIPGNARTTSVRDALKARIIADGGTESDATMIVDSLIAEVERQASKGDPEELGKVLQLAREKAAEERGEPLERLVRDESGGTVSEAPTAVSEVREANGRFEFTIESEAGSRTIAVKDRSTAEELREGEVARIEEADDEARAEAATLVEPEAAEEEKAPEIAAESVSEEEGRPATVRRPQGAFQDAAVEQFLEDRSRTPEERAALAKEAEEDAKAIEEFMARKRAERESPVEPETDEGQSGGESPKSSEKVGATPGRAEAEGVRSAFSEMDSILDSGEDLHPAFAEAAKARALAKELAPQAEADGALRLRRDDGQSAIVSQSAQKGDAPWRVTFFDDSGEPLSHVVAQNAEDAARVATREGYTPDPQATKKAPTVAALPTETDIFGQETEKKPRARKEGAPVKAEQALLIDDQKGDIPGQQTLTDLSDEAKAEEEEEGFPWEREEKAAEEDTELKEWSSVGPIIQTASGDYEFVAKGKGAGIFSSRSKSIRDSSERKIRRLHKEFTDALGQPAFSGEIKEGSSYESVDLIKEFRAELAAVRRMDARMARAKYQTSSKSSAIAKVERKLEAAERRAGLETVTERRARKSAAAKARIKASPPKDLHTLIRRAGGIINDGGDFSNLAESDAQKGQAPGESSLVQKPGSGKGVPLDQAIELAVDAGFFPGREARDIDPQEFRDALEENALAPDVVAEETAEAEEEHRRRIEEQWEAEAEKRGEPLDDADRQMIDLSWETFRQLTAQTEPTDAVEQDAKNLEPDDGFDEFEKLYASGLDLTTDFKNFIEDYFRAKRARTLTRDGVNPTEAQLELQMTWKRRLFDSLISKRAPLDRFLEILKVGGATISELSDVALWERMRQGRTVDRLVKERKRQESIIKRIQKSPVPVDGQVDNDPNGVTEPGFNDHLRARNAFDRNRMISQRLTESERRKIKKTMERKIEHAEAAFERAEKRLNAELRGAERALNKKRKKKEGQLFGDEERARALNQLRGEHAEKVLNARLQMERRIQDARHEAIVHDTGLRSPNEAGSGMSDEKAARILAAVKKHKHRADFEAVAKEFDEMNARTRKALFDYGLINQLQLDEWERTQPFYAPLRSDLSEIEKAHLKGTGQGISILGKESRAATGRRSEAQDTLQYAMMQSDMAIIRGEKNLVGRSLLELIRNLNRNGILGDVAEILVGPTTPVVSNGMIRHIHDSRKKTEPNVISTKVNGQEILIELKEGYESIAIALKNLHAEEMGEMVRYWGAATRFLAGTHTRWNPLFWPRNLFRDVGGAFFNSNADKAGAGKYVLKHVKGAFGALHADAKGESVADAEWARYLEEFRSEGAPIAYLDYRNIQTLSKDLQRRMRRMQDKGTLGQLAENGQAIKEWTESWSDIFENSTRLAAYRMAREHMGLSPKRAALYAKEITTNFEEKGNLGNLLNAMYMFATAGIGGNRRVLQAVRKVGFKKILARSMISLAMYDMLARAIMGVDDDGENFWDKIPGYIKDSNFVIPNVLGDPGDYFKIPIPYGWAFFHSLGLRTGAVITGNMEIGEAGALTAFSAVNAANPLGSTDNWVQLVSPTLTDPFVQISQNKDWKGSQIHKNPYHAPKGTPDHKLFWPDQANAYTAGFTRWLFETTQAKSLDFNPADIEHLIMSYTGGIGAEMWRLGNLSFKLADTEETVRVDEVPLVRSFYAKQSPFDSMKRFARNLDELEIEKNAAKERGETQDPERAQLYRFGNKLKSRLQDARDAARELKGEKRDAMTAAIDDANKAFNRLASEVRTFVSLDPGSRGEKLREIDALYRAVEDAAEKVTR